MRKKYLINALYALGFFPKNQKMPPFIYCFLKKLTFLLDVLAFLGWKRYNLRARLFCYVCMLFFYLFHFEVLVFLPLK